MSLFLNTKEDKMGEENSMHGIDEKCKQTFSRESE
jgi:hypothetical protein